MAHLAARDGAIGYGAHLAILRRTASGKFDAAGATPLDMVLNFTAAQPEQKVIPFFKLAAV